MFSFHTCTWCCSHPAAALLCPCPSLQPADPAGGGDLQRGGDGGAGSGPGSHIQTPEAAGTWSRYWHRAHSARSWDSQSERLGAGEGEMWWDISIWGIKGNIRQPKIKTEKPGWDPGGLPKKEKQDRARSPAPLPVRDALAKRAGVPARVSINSHVCQGTVGHSSKQPTATTETLKKQNKKELKTTHPRSEKTLLSKNSPATDHPPFL